MKVFLDTDVILDVAVQRQPFCEEANQIFALAEKNKFNAVTSPVVYVNVFYHLRKCGGKDVAKKFLKNMIKIIDVVSTTKAEVRSAIDSNFSDFEDAVQNFSAISACADVIVTRNVKDYKTSSAEVLLPKDFLATIFH